MVRPRVPEGGAIKDDSEWSMEDYSEHMKIKLGREYRTLVKEILERFEIPKNGKILEIGPGPGWIGIWLLKERPDLTLHGLEPSDDMRRVAGKNAEKENLSYHITYINGYVENMEMIEDKTYDLIFSNGSLHHWEDPPKGFKEISRVLKDDGSFLLQDGRRDLNLGGKFILYVLGPIMAGKMWKYWKSSVYAGYTKDEIEEMIKKIPERKWQVETDLFELKITC